jgi:ribonuclease PH
MGEEIWLDPNHEEASAGASTLVLASMPVLNVVTNVWQNGTMSPKQGLEVSSAKPRVPLPKFCGTDSV